MPPRAPQEQSARREALQLAAAARSEVSRRRFFRNVRADIRRHGTLFTRSVIGLMVYRFGGWALTQPRWIRFLAMKVYGLFERLTRVLTGLNMHCSVHTGEGLHLVHAEGPISIHPDVVLGDRVGIMHNVTIGLAIDQLGAPMLGNDVFVGTGAVIVGPVVIGDNARIAGNSLVIADVPPNSLAIGVPARILPRLDFAATAAAAGDAPPRRAPASGDAATGRPGARSVP